jgi:hypothetical protein
MPLQKEGELTKKSKKRFVVKKSFCRNNFKLQNARVALTLKILFLVF